MSEDKKVNQEVADYAIRDPFKTVNAIQLKDSGELEKRAQELLIQALSPHVPGINEESRVVITSSARHPRSVIDAKPTLTCNVCKGLCWQSPSSLSAPFDAVMCEDCLPSELKAIFAEIINKRASECFT